MKRSELIERLKVVRELLVEDEHNAAIPDLVEAMDLVLDLVDLPVIPKQKRKPSFTVHKAPKPTPDELRLELEQSINELFEELFKWSQKR